METGQVLQAHSDPTLTWRDGVLDQPAEPDSGLTHTTRVWVRISGPAVGTWRADLTVLVWICSSDCS